MTFASMPGAEEALAVIAIVRDWDEGLRLGEHFRLGYSNHRWNRETHRMDPAEPHFTVRAECSDAFAWGSADSEAVTAESMQILADVAADLRVIWSRLGSAQWEKQWDVSAVMPTLFAARVRGMRPQGAMYKHLPEETWPLFDACGPARDVNGINPHPQPKA